jgi:RNA polymerase sigma-70 factor (ECF subfamily)
MEVSKDIVQDVFIKLWERDMKISSKVTMKPFMYVTVRNACINYIRQKNREEKRILDYAVLNSDSLFEYNVMEEDVSYKLFKAVDQLSPRSKEAILLTVQEYSNQEIATKMKVSINTVKTLKQRSYQRLRQAVIATICFLLLCI